MESKTKSKIGFSSRYYEPFQTLKARLDSQSVFKLIHNEDKDTYSLPYLYSNYKNELEPISIAEGIIKSIKNYLNDNLFSKEEKELLLSELRPYIEIYGSGSINHLKDRINLTNELGSDKDLQILLEYQKTIDALKKINDLINIEFSTGSFMTPNTTEPIVFISYSHDSETHKDWVLQLATRLRSNGVNVILDRWNLKLGSDLASFMETGLSKSNRIICICSDVYVKKANEGKGGSGYEKQIMTAELIIDQNTNWIIPLIKNNSNERKTPTFLGGRFYISFEDANLYETKYEDLLRDLLDEPVLPIPPIGKNPFQTIKEFAQQKFIPASEKYVSPATSGTVTFDFSNNNGNYAIGQGELMFETSWSSSGTTSIHLYNDPSSIRAIAVVKDTGNLKEIKDARIYDNSSRARTVNLNQIAILQNNNGFFAAVKVLSIKIDKDGKGNDELTFEYCIQTNGTPDFTT